ncbi:MAG TPA: hypothetical protein VEG68_06215 [Terriglobales bacterium]|nr:hypothetical protein [Terriglobales bacterium]
MITAKDVAKALAQQATEDLKHLKAIHAEQAKLRPQVIRFRDLEDQAKAKEARIRRAVSLLEQGDVYINEREAKDDFSAFVVSISDLTLWEAMTAILEQESEMQIVELQHVLEQLGKKVTRQAIESSIATHRDKFDTKTRNRDRFVSLKR